MAEERRLVTVLFADVVGSTALGEELDPEDVRGLVRTDRDDLRSAQASFMAMDARTYLARVTTELGSRRSATSSRRRE